MKFYYNRTKIVATMGPACSKKEVLLSMIRAGLNVCRLNFSHGKPEDHKKFIDLIREINDEYKTNVGILADLQGPKIRIGLVKDGGIHLINGTRINITTNECIGDDNQIYITYETFPQDVQANEIILLDDGKLQLKVIETNRKDTVICEVVHGGILTSRKGVNLPNTKVSIPSLTPDDLVNLQYALQWDVDWVGLSFVRTGQDI
ncbi:pyruvate kinase, partial [Mucilaginibacter sp. 10I4]